MATIKINLSSGELSIEFTDTKDLEEHLEKIDLTKIDTLLNNKKQDLSSLNITKEEDGQTPKNVKDLGTINLLKVSEGKEDVVKLAVFLAASGMNREEIK